MRKVIERCPACGGGLTVSKLSCGRCETEISGRFSTSVFDRLSSESLAFVELFVRLRGNIKEMERELDVPYSTVRSRLDDVIGELGFENERKAATGSAGIDESQRTDVLGRLDRGEIDAEAAIRELEKLKER